MNEKIYKKMKNIGGGSIAIGIITIVVGIACGITMIINGARLLTGKDELTI